MADVTPFFHSARGLKSYSLNISATKNRTTAQCFETTTNDHFASNTFTEIQYKAIDRNPHSV